MRLLLLIISGLLLVTPLLVGAQQRYVPIEQRLSTEQLKATGLDSLSAQQLQLLNRLLSDEQVVVEKRVEESARSRVAGLLDRQDAEPVHAAIKGEFRGWAGGTVVELDNGQRWRVTEGELYLRKPMVNPKATISPGMVGGWYLQVEGQSPRAKVKRLP
ncbi:MAG: hypothetical protein ACREPE_10915 [Lysobacter sp.]